MKRREFVKTLGAAAAWLTSDPHESRNLAGDPAQGGILNDYRQRCRERADKAGRAGERM
jgi:hypothetical protein